MKKTKITNKIMIADLSLLLAAMLWGGGYAATKNALNNITPFYMMTIRFLCAGILLSAVFLKQ